jgi:hypothetical protein
VSKRERKREGRRKREVIEKKIEGKRGKKRKVEKGREGEIT